MADRADRAESRASLQAGVCLHHAQLNHIDPTCANSPPNPNPVAWNASNPKLKARHLKPPTLLAKSPKNPQTLSLKP